MSENEARSARLKKLSFRSWRRGFKEADLILGHFADARLASMTDVELDAFEEIIEVPDQDLYNWIIERDTPPPQFDGEILKQLNMFYKTVYKSIQS